MGVIKDRHGTFQAQQRVPKRLRAAVARLLGNGKAEQGYLKKSLGTKEPKAANVRAKPVLAEFDQVIRKATALLETVAAPVEQRSTLNAAEIARMAEYVFAKTLAWDERFRVGGRDELKRLEGEVRAQLARDGEEWQEPKYAHDALPPYGLSREQFAYDKLQLESDIRSNREALALGDISAVEIQIGEALDAFGISLEPGSLSYPTLGIAVLRSYLRALQALEQRNAGQVVETPTFAAKPQGGSADPQGGTHPRSRCRVESPARSEPQCHIRGHAQRRAVRAVAWRFACHPNQTLTCPHVSGGVAVCAQAARW